jgi:hypothetical protein
MEALDLSNRKGNDSKTTKQNSWVDGQKDMQKENETSNATINARDMSVASRPWTERNGTRLKKMETEVKNVEPTCSFSLASRELHSAIATQDRSRSDKDRMQGEETKQKGHHSLDKTTFPKPDDSSSNVRQKEDPDDLLESFIKKRTAERAAEEEYVIRKIKLSDSRLDSGKYFMW